MIKYFLVPISSDSINGVPNINRNKGMTETCRDVLCACRVLIDYVADLLDCLLSSIVLLIDKLGGGKAILQSPVRITENVSSKRPVRRTSISVNV